jgi:hypothetical protein
MATTRYNQRKDYEAAEANAIGTEFARAGLLPAEDAARVRQDVEELSGPACLVLQNPRCAPLQQINASTAQLQTDLWSAVQGRASAQPTPIVALIIAGMNDVLDSQAYTQAAWSIRIPIAAWILMATIAICRSVLVGYTTRRRSEAKAKRFSCYR